jgi:hypothetical protein
LSIPHLRHHILPGSSGGVLITPPGGSDAEDSRGGEAETVDLDETDGDTTVTTRFKFADRSGRARMTRFDGQADSFDKMDAVLRSVHDSSGRACQ